MEEINIVFPHERFEEVNDILYKQKVGGLSFYDIKGRGQAERKALSERRRNH